MGANCTASVSIGCLFCCQGCNAEKLRNAFTFLPPPSSYAVEESGGKDSGDKNGKDSTAGSGKIVYLSEGLRSFSCYQPAADIAKVHLIRTRLGEKIPIVWLRHSGASSAASPVPGDDAQRPLVMLHCHGNATDIGMMMGPYFEMSRQLGIEVVGVEYSGYGTSSGAPSSRNVQADIEAAYQFVVASGVAPERIVAYGQSVGSGPALSLAAKHTIGGVILHSPLMSGIKVIDPEPDRCCRPSCVYHCFDFFPNDKWVKAVSCPAFIIHGQLDDIIPFYHGHRLSEFTPKPYRWPGYFPPGAGHNNIVEMNTSGYFRQVGAFLRSVAERSGAGMDEFKEIEKPAQVEMMLEPNIPGSKEEVNSLEFAEPAVGPEDGRYEHLRRGRGSGGKGSGGGQARELHASAAEE